jgi:peroxiredoxin
MSQRTIEAGDVLPPYDLVTLRGERLRIPDARRSVHLQFRRFASCPICNLHLRSFSARHAEIVTAGVLEVVVFHSPADAMQPHQGDLPFATIPDPDKKLYAQFGVGTSPLAMVDPRVWGTIMRAVAQPRPPGTTIKADGGSFGLPADFLISREGRVVARKYGLHADDQWSVDELLALARGGD